MSTEEVKTCRSVSPVVVERLNGFACTKPRGHKGRNHSNPQVKKKWVDGINVPATWEFIDDGRMSEADWQTWGKLWNY